MDIHVTKTKLDGVVVIDTDFFRDDRGFFIEVYHKQRYIDAGLDYDFVQDNHSRSAYKVLRGFHYQDMTRSHGQARALHRGRCAGCRGRPARGLADLRAMGGRRAFGRQHASDHGASRATAMRLRRSPTLRRCTTSARGCIRRSRKAACAGTTRRSASNGRSMTRFSRGRDQQSGSLQDYLKEPAFKYSA